MCGGRVKIGGIRIAKKTARGGEDEEREKRGGALITHTQKKTLFFFFFLLGKDSVKSLSQVTHFSEL